MQTISNETTIDVQLHVILVDILITILFFMMNIVHIYIYIYIYTQKNTWPLEFYLRTVNNFSVNFPNNSVAIVDELQEE